MSQKDTLYRDGSVQHDQFVFDERVVRVFPDMIRRSVPGYGLILPSIALMARRHVQPNSHIYDLGCSLGAVSLAISDVLEDKNNRIIAVDRSPDMIAQFRSLAKERAGHGPGKVPLDILEADILETAIANASFVVMNFTLQFIDPEKRKGLLQRIYEGMNPGAVLVLSEKLRFIDPVEQDRQNEWHLDFKRAQGYSELEVARKRDAIEDMMKPDPFEKHLDRLKAIGFVEAYRWFQCFSFCSMVAVR